MSQILIVEDEPRLRQDLGDFLKLRGFEVTSAACAQEMRAAFANQLAPDVVILDVGLPDGNGFDLALEIRKGHNCGIIMLSAYGDTGDRVRGFDSGADIYLVKHSPLREVEAAIRSLLRRTREARAAAGGTSGSWALDTTSWELASPDGKSLRLTGTEFAFLHLLCQRQGQTCTREELATALARPSGHFENRHLDAIVSRLRRKIESATAHPPAIKVVYGVGYTFAAPVVVE